MRWRRNAAEERRLMRRVREKRPARTPGPHLYDLITCTRKAWSRHNEPELWAEGGPAQESDELTLITFLGQGHHMLLSFNDIPTRYSEELGVDYSTDDLDEEPEDSNIELTVPIEYKTTRISSKKTPENQEIHHYIDQLAGYCVARHRRHGRLHVFHIVGQYNPPTPQHRCYDFFFENYELTAWKQELLRRRQILTFAQSFDAIPLAEHETWECNYCPLKELRCPGGPGGRKGWFADMAEEAMVP